MIERIEILERRVEMLEQLMDPRFITPGRPNLWGMDWPEQTRNVIELLVRTSPRYVSTAYLSYFLAKPNEEPRETNAGRVAIHKARLSLAALNIEIQTKAKAGYRLSIIDRDRLKQWFDLAETTDTPPPSFVFALEQGKANAS